MLIIQIMNILKLLLNENATIVCLLNLIINIIDLYSKNNGGYKLLNVDTNIPIYIKNKGLYFYKPFYCFTGKFLENSFYIF